MAKKIGRSSWLMEQPPSILAWSAVAGKKESEGPLANLFDIIYDDDTLGQSTWEKAESKLQQDTLESVLKKASLSPEKIDMLFAGDLLNQCIGTTYSMRDFNIPFYGLYGACSTMAESLSLASLFVENGLSQYTIALTSSHFCSAERQFRLPLEYGGQRTPTSQWTVTGSGGILIGKKSHPPYVQSITAGKIVDMGIQDATNMGAAMAPAAADTIFTHLRATNTTPKDYDAIVTGDLGQVGSQLLIELLQQQQVNLSYNHQDCGLLIFDRSDQTVHAGGSGCGCSASVLCSLLLKQLHTKEIKNMLFVATGALMSPVSQQQGESIPSIAHVVHLCSELP